MQEEAASKGIKVDACRAMERFDKIQSGGLTRTRASPCMIAGKRWNRVEYPAFWLNGSVRHGGGSGAMAHVVFTGYGVLAWWGDIFPVQVLRWPIRRE